MKGQEARICQWGNGNGIRLQQSVLKRFGLTTGDYFLMEVDDSKIVLIPEKEQKDLTLQDLFKDYNGPTREELFRNESKDWDSMIPVGEEIVYY